MAQDAIRLITTALPRGRPIPAASHAFPGVEPAHSNPTIDACDVRQAHGRGAGIARLPRQPGLSYGRVRWTTVTKHPTDSMKPRPNCRCMWIRSGGGCGKGGSRWWGRSEATDSSHGLVGLGRLTGLYGQGIIGGLAFLFGVTLSALLDRPVAAIVGTFRHFQRAATQGAGSHRRRPALLGRQARGQGLRCLVVLSRPSCPAISVSPQCLGRLWRSQVRAVPGLGEFHWTARGSAWPVIDRLASRIANGHPLQICVFVEDGHGAGVGQKGNGAGVSKRATRDGRQAAREALHSLETQIKGQPPVRD